MNLYTYIYFLIIIITWGLNPILTRIGSNLTDPRAYMILFSLINTSSLLIINSIIDNDVWSKIRLFNTFKPIIIVVVDGVICMAIPAYLYNILVSDKSNNISVIVITTWYGAPIMTSILSYFIFKEILSLLQIGGVLITIIGLIMINIESVKPLPPPQEVNESVPLRSAQLSA
jgi:drug/metabolite transporter (DMT)-like permease